MVRADATEQPGSDAANQHHKGRDLPEHPLTGVPHQEREERPQSGVADQVVQVSVQQRRSENVPNTCQIQRVHAKVVERPAEHCHVQDVHGPDNRDVAEGEQQPGSALLLELALALRGGVHRRVDAKRGKLLVRVRERAVEGLAVTRLPSLAVAPAWPRCVWRLRHMLTRPSSPAAATPGRTPATR